MTYSHPSQWDGRFLPIRLWETGTLGSGPYTYLPAWSRGR